MGTSADHSPGEGAPLFVAGHIAPAGTYHLVGTGREVRRDQKAGDLSEPVT